MPDFVYLGGPTSFTGGSLGSGMEIGSTLLIEGQDWGQDLINIQYAQAVQSEGGPIAFTSIPNRQIKLPFIYRGTSVDDTHQFVQNLNRTVTAPGNVAAVRFENASWATLFDIRGGRVTVNRDLRYHRAQIIHGTVELSTDPFGYTPTWMVAASAPSSFQLTPIAGSVMGDVPAKARVTISMATCVASGIGVAGALISWLPQQKSGQAPGWYRATSAQVAAVGTIGTVNVAGVAQFNGPSAVGFPPEITNGHYTLYLTPAQNIPASVAASYRMRTIVIGRLADGASHTGAQVRVGWKGNTTGFQAGLQSPLSPWSYFSYPSSAGFPTLNSFLIDCGELPYPSRDQGELYVEYKPWPVQFAGASGCGLTIDVVAMLPVDSWLGYFTTTPQDTFSSTSAGNWSTKLVADAYLSQVTTQDGNTFSQFGFERYRGPLPFLAPGNGEFALLGAGVASNSGLIFPATTPIAVPSQVMGIQVVYQPRWLFMR